MISEQSIIFSNISATPANFALKGGLYQIALVATWGGGSVTFNQVGPDGSTLLSVATAFTANGGTTLYLPPGVYQLTVATATGISIAIRRVEVS